MGQYEKVIGILFNCCEPESISKAMYEIRRDIPIQEYLQHPLCDVSPNTRLRDNAPPKIFLGAYANRLTPIDPKWTLESSDGAQAMRDDMSPDQYSSNFVDSWVDSNRIGGVQLIGGCCGIGPGHISVLRDRFDR